MAKKNEQPDALQSLKQAIRSKNPGRLYFFSHQMIGVVPNLVPAGNQFPYNT